jgi:hypothetical protein
MAILSQVTKVSSNESTETALGKTGKLTEAGNRTRG